MMQQFASTMASNLPPPLISIQVICFHTVNCTCALTHFALTLGWVGGMSHNIFYPSPVQVLSKVLGTMNTDTTEDLGAVKEIIHHKTVLGKSTKKNTQSTRPGKLHF